MKTINIFKDFLPETVPVDISRLNIIQQKIINTLSENQYTISETRYLFNSILSRLEESMPIINHFK